MKTASMLLLALALSGCAGQTHWTDAKRTRAERDPAYAERVFQRICPNGANGYDDKTGPSCD